MFFARTFLRGNSNKVPLDRLICSGEKTENSNQHSKMLSAYFKKKHNRIQQIEKVVFVKKRKAYIPGFLKTGLLKNVSQ